MKNKGDRIEALAYDIDNLYDFIRNQDKLNEGFGRIAEKTADVLLNLSQRLLDAEAEIAEGQKALAEVRQALSDVRAEQTDASTRVLRKRTAGWFPELEAPEDRDELYRS